MDHKEYDQLAESLKPTGHKMKNAFYAFLYGGVIGAIAQGVLEFFCLLFHFAAYPVCGIQLQDSGHEQGHHPVIVYVRNIQVPAEPDEVVVVCKHEQGGEQETHIAGHHYAPQAAYGDAAAVVALLQLHEHESQCAYGKHVWRPALRQHVGGAAYNH